MLYIGTQEQIQEYRNSPAVNQSTLKDLQFGLDSFLRKQREPISDEVFIIGSAVDCILTGRDGQFEEEFYVSSMEKKPSETEMKIVEFVFIKSQSNSTGRLGNLQNYLSVIEDAVITHNWQSNWKIETRVNKIANNELCQEYFEDLKLSQGKSVLSLAQYGEVMKVVESLRNNENTKKFFDREYLKNAENLVTLYQIPIYFTFGEMECKALPDIMLITTNDKKEIEEIQLVDLKTTYDTTLNFHYAVSKFRYDIQSAFYLTGIENVSKSFFSKFGLSFTNFTVINPFLFVVESTTIPGTPLIFQVSSKLEHQGIYGIADILYSDRILKKGKKGFNDLLQEYKYYQETEFKEDILLKDRDGIFVLELEGIS